MCDQKIPDDTVIEMKAMLKTYTDSQLEIKNILEHAIKQNNRRSNIKLIINFLYIGFLIACLVLGTLVLQHLDLIQ